MSWRHARATRAAGAPNPLAPRLENNLITAATVNPKKGHMLRYLAEHFAHEAPALEAARRLARGFGGPGTFSLRNDSVDLGPVYRLPAPNTKRHSMTTSD